MIEHRTAVEGDAADIAALIRSLQSELLIDPAGKGAEEFLASVSTETIRSCLASPQYAFLVAHEDGRLVGVIAIRNRVHLFYFFVDRAHQRRGLGRGLWELARAQAEAGGHPGFFTVGASMNAVPVYARLGFRETGPPFDIHGVRCVPMAVGEMPQSRAFALVLPAETTYPALNEAAVEILQELDAAFAGRPDGRIQTRIAAAASLAGSVLVREAGVDPELHPDGRTMPSDAQRRQAEMMIFMEIIAPSIDPAIGRGIVPGEGLKGRGWGDDVAPEHAPPFDADTMLNRLAGLPERVTDQHGIAPMVRAHVVGLAAMKLISSGHRSGVLDQRVGKALVRCYLAAGSKSPPVPLHES